jgi:hypothetical protein
MGPPSTWRRRRKALGWSSPSLTFRRTRRNARASVQR